MPITATTLARHRMILQRSGRRLDLSIRPAATCLVHLLASSELGSASKRLRSSNLGPAEMPASFFYVASLQTASEPSPPDFNEPLLKSHSPPGRARGLQQCGARLIMKRMRKD